ncbi:cobalt ABC transporter, inner membrane subunit CbiQ [Oscillochloris trichoides DG-6]|uniref:Cobalt ABC transporter, inner membrane subunit CbiQ n=1 Tax=Oscillochloris trichoides DG-6 TaxID=765420 RepID=E1IGG1_9CHLR|nr:cobalt ECF transporter T component CbiQ [Oscillochloris trichoides]EFO79727.1 cobalt ABC transporter, inner membrane subunit CbiQ [Oscillochloris trichoides DG-6]
MQVIDRYAYSNAIRQVDPAQKAALALVALLLCLLLDHPLVSGLTIGWMLGLAVGWARLPGRVVVQTLAAQALFLLASTLGVALSLSWGGVAPRGWAVQIGSLWLSSSPEALQHALALVARALGSVAALNFLILTTPLVDLIDLLRRLRTPEVVIDLMTLTYRAIFVLLESLERMRIAQEARLGYCNPQRAMQSSALLISQLFIESYRRSLRLQESLESRGFQGSLRVLPSSYRYDVWAWRLGAVIVVSLVLARLTA